MSNKSWDKVKISSLCLKVGDGLHGTPKYTEESNIFFINGNNLKRGSIEINDDTKKVTEAELIKNYVELNDNSLLMSINGTLGSLAFYKGERVMLGKSAAYLNFNSEINRFYYYYFQLRGVQDYFYNVATGSTIKNLGLKSIKDFEVPKPPKDEWEQIAKVLSDLDAKIEVNNKINQELEAMAKLVYDYWFVQFNFPIPQDYAAFIGKPELAGKPYKASGGKMVFNKELKREIPEGWEDGVIADLIKNDKSGDWGKDEVQGNYTVEVSCIRGADINGINGQGEVKAPKRFILEKNTHKILEPFDLVVEISGGSPTQSTGRLTYVTEATQERFDNPLICSNFCKALTLKESKSLFNFVFEWNRLYDAGVLFGWEGKTSGIKNLLFDNFVTNHKIPLVPIELMNQFFDKVYSVHQKIQKNLLENQKLAELRDWLLPMLMNGQVRVAHSLEEGNPKEAYDEIEDMVSGPDSYREAAEDGGKYGEG